MQLNLIKWEYQDQLSEIRTILIDGEFWFAAMDITSVLGYSGKVSDIISRHCKKGGIVKHDTPTKSGVQALLYISESNVYRLAIKSKMPDAEKFELWLMEEVLPSIRKKGYYGLIDRSATPNFAVRYKLNWAKTDKGYFSVISMLYITLYASLERAGYIIPDKGINEKELRPDTSVGILFSKYLEKYYPMFANKYKKYLHTFKDGSKFKCRQYENMLMHIFIQFVEDVWIPERAYDYFATRDPLALEFLPLLIQANAA